VAINQFEKQLQTASPADSHKKNGPASVTEVEDRFTIYNNADVQRYKKQHPQLQAVQFADKRVVIS